MVILKGKLQPIVENILKEEQCGCGWMRSYHEISNRGKKRI
jgi:hypothetical protein